MKSSFRIGNRSIGDEAGVFVVAEIAGNHGGSFDRAEELVRAAHNAGADAVKLQTFTADTITFDGDGDWFRLPNGRTLFDVYRDFETPWEWHAPLQGLATELGIILFSSPFSLEAVDRLERLAMPAYKVASFELVDIPLIERAAATGMPLLISTGMATLGEIERAVEAAERAGCNDLALLKCTSKYPSSPRDLNLRTIPHLKAAFGVPVGLSDHTVGIHAPVAAVAFGASVIEKHLLLSRADGGPEAAFALEPADFRAMVEAVRATEEALGTVHYGLTADEEASRRLRRSLFLVEDVARGQRIKPNAVRSIRPADGLPPEYLGTVLKRRARRSLKAGTPLAWELLE